jgi:hypothetical protein
MSVLSDFTVFRKKALAKKFKGSQPAFAAAGDTDASRRDLYSDLRKIDWDAVQIAADKRKPFSGRQR